MAKATKEVVTEAEVAIDYRAKWKEVRENLVVQLKDHSEKSEHHRTMATKAQGDLEVMLQLIPKEEVEEMIAKEEETNNSSNGEVVEG